jgi:predicted DNA-binding transcriptional regulator YafY
MKQMQIPRLVRLLKAVALLLERPHTPLSGVELMQGIGEVSEEVEVLNDSQRRAFERIKEDLRDIGVPLETKQIGIDENTAVYSIPQQKYTLLNLNLTGEEQVILNLIRQVLAEEENFPLRANLGMALQKISSYAPYLFGELSEKPYVAGSPEPVPAKQDQEILDLLVEAGANQHPVTFEYSAFNSNTTRKREVEPYGFFTRKGIWYLVGRDLEIDKLRVFRVSRITTLKSLTVHKGTTFEIPEDFNLRDYSSVPPWNFLFDQEEKEAVVRVEPEAFWRVRDFCQQHGETTEETHASGEGPVWWKLKVRDYDPLICWMLPFGTALLPTEPVDFVRRYREVVKETLSRYGGQTLGTPNL